MSYEIEHRTNFDEGRYAPVFARQGHSPTLRSIWAEAYGRDYSEEVEPLGFSTLTDLSRAATELGVRPGQRFVDLGCGRGGPGLWLARETGAAVTGIDLVPEAVAEATRRSTAFGVDDRSAYRVGSFTDSGLESHRFDAALSIDSLWMVLDKPAAVAEVARLLKPGSRWVCTTWEPTYVDHRALMESAGFRVLVIDEPSDWQRRQLAVYEGILRESDRLLDELGPEAVGVLINEARQVPPMIDTYRRLFIVAATYPAGDRSMSLG